MLGNTLKFFVVILTFVFFVSEVSTKYDIVANVELDSKEKQAIIDHNQSEPDEGIEEKDENGDAGVSISKAENSEAGTEDDVNEEGVGKNIKVYAGSDGQKSHEDTHEHIKKFKEKRKPLWKIKDKPGKRQEPGFDLRPEEKKKFKIWKAGAIPYYIDDISFSDEGLRDKIRHYLEMINSAAGLNFVELSGPPSDDKKRWVFFMNRRGILGCADHTVKKFTTQGVQQVVLGYDCIETRGELAEAVMSIVGVPAQHNAPDRDKYIQVNMENIMPDKKYLFEKLQDDEWLFHDLDYDFNSITHYDVFKYSVNGRATIQLKNESIDLGVAKKLSSDDLLKMKMLYNYVTRNQLKLQSQDCEKLFKPRSKFERFVPHIVHVKPRKKPSRYSTVTNERLSMNHQHREGTKHLQQLIKNSVKNKNEENQNDTFKQKLEDYKNHKNQYIYSKHHTIRHGNQRSQQNQTTKLDKF